MPIIARTNTTLGPTPGKGLGLQRFSLPVWQNHPLHGQKWIWIQVDQSRWWCLHSLASSIWCCCCQIQNVLMLLPFQRCSWAESGSTPANTIYFAHSNISQAQEQEEETNCMQHKINHLSPSTSSSKLGRLLSFFLFYSSEEAGLYTWYKCGSRRTMMGCIKEMIACLPGHCVRPRTKDLLGVRTVVVVAAEWRLEVPPRREFLQKLRIQR